MRLTTLSLESFRSYEKFSMTIGEGSHLFLGPNGSGKTNLIEAISFLSQARSCLRASPEDAVRFGHEFMKVRADTLSDAGEAKSLEYVFQRTPRRSSAFFQNDVRVSLLEFIGLLPSITFLPQALSLCSGPPADRRGFLDGLITQLRPLYAAERLEYERILKQRNALLKAIVEGEAQENDLDLWDDRLALSGSTIVMERIAVLDAVNGEFLSCLQSLGERYVSAELTYIPTSVADSAASLREAMRKARSRDIALQSTTVGPHRDDWRCIADTHDMAFFASRGQQRTALLALLFVAAGLFQRSRSERPLILLDDVLSELDQRHQTALLSHFADHQVLITGTHAIDDAPHLTRWTVGDATVERVNAP